MFHPLPLFVGLRYVRARTRKFFVSFITWASLAGVCVGVAALIVILSVMNGLENELRDQLVALGSHARIVAKVDATVSESDWSAALQAVRATPGVQGAARYVELQALAVHTPEMLPVILRGIDPRAESAVSGFERSIVEGHLSDLSAGSGHLIVGSVIAERLAIAPGDPLTILVPAVSPEGTPSPKLREMTVAGEFEVGRAEHDGTLVFANIADVRELTSGSGAGEGLRVRFRDAMQAPALAAGLRPRLPSVFELFDWTQDNASYFRAVRIEKTMMSLILLLIVAVAAFNIVSMLVMVVTNKRTDIAILRTLGASPRRVMGVFITQGLVIGWLGVALGVTLGLSLALNVDTVVPLLEKTFHFQIFDSDVYYITRIPSDVRWPNVALISGCALLLTGAATLYPALRASRTAPAEALRYE